MKNQGLNPVEFFLALVNNVNDAPQSVQKLFGDFMREAEEEWMPSRDKLREYYRQPNNLRALKNGSFGKLNGKYIWRVILECKNDFDDYVRETSEKLLPGHEGVVRDMTMFSAKSLLSFDNVDYWADARSARFDYDILGWKENKYEGSPGCRDSTYIFSLPKDQKDALNTLLAQYKNPNMNVTLRKVSEHMRISDLFYKIEKVV